MKIDIKKIILLSAYLAAADAVNATMINLGLEMTVTTINLGLILDGDQSIVSQGDFEHTLENIRLEPAHLEVNATYE